MRALKYRAWHDGLMYTVYKIEFNETGISFIHMIDEQERILFHTDNTEHYVLMQYTGLKDINGKEIYESDLVQDIIDGSIDVVEWVEDIDTDRDWQHCTGFLIDLRRSIYCKDSRLNVEIVGNLYETPHLAPEEVR